MKPDESRAKRGVKSSPNILACGTRGICPMLCTLGSLSRRLPLVPSPVPHLAKAISPEYAGFVLGVDAPDERIKADGERTKTAGFGSGLKGCDPGRFEFAERMS